MKVLNSVELCIIERGIKLWVCIIPGTKKNYGFVNLYFIFEHTKTFCWVCFAGKMPASNILYNLLYY
jgi:hypothetical protein